MLIYGRARCAAGQSGPGGPVDEVLPRVLFSGRRSAGLTQEALLDAWGQWTVTTQSGTATPRSRDGNPAAPSSPADGQHSLTHAITIGC